MVASTHTAGALVGGGPAKKRMDTTTRRVRAVRGFYGPGRKLIAVGESATLPTPLALEMIACGKAVEAQADPIKAESVAIKTDPEMVKSEPAAKTERSKSA